MAKWTALEPCCGNGVEWKDERPILTIAGDKLIALPHQHVVLDFCRLPFRDSVFSRIFFDPPHLIRGDWAGHLNPKYLRFGRWHKRSEWEAALDSVNVEFHRVSRPGALLFTKIIHGKDRRVTKIEDLDRLTLWEPIDWTVRRSKVGWSTCKTINTVFRRRARL